MTVRVQLGEELYGKAAELAVRENISVEKLVSLAVERQLREWEWLQSRAQRGRHEKFLAVLERAPDVEPEEQDRV